MSDTRFDPASADPRWQAYDRARRSIAELGARSSPWSLDEIEGREARSVRHCLTPAERDPAVERQVRAFLRHVLADDAGTFDQRG